MGFSCRWSNSQGIGRTSLLLFLGQVVSFNLAISNFCVSLITNQGVHTPLTFSFVTYVALAVVYGSIMLYRQQKILVPWYWYILLGFVDVQGNYLVIRAYEYTSITSVTILNCWTIAWAMLLTWLFLGTKYSLWQFFGAGVCVGGLGLVMLSDFKQSVGGGSNPLLGDFLVVAGTVFLALSSVGQEYCVKKRDRIEAMTMLGVFGMLVSGTLMTVLEKKHIQSINWSPQLVLSYFGGNTASFLFYTVSPFVLKMSGATLFTLSLLTSNMWAVVIRIFIYKQQVNWLYYPAYGVAALGLLIYANMEKNPGSSVDADETNTNPDYSLLLDEESLAPPR